MGEESRKEVAVDWLQISGEVQKNRVDGGKTAVNSDRQRAVMDV